MSFLHPGFFFWFMARSYFDQIRRLIIGRFLLFGSRTTLYNIKQPPNIKATASLSR